MDVIAMARELGKELQKTEGYKKFDVARAAADADTELQTLIGEFNLKKQNLSLIMQGQDKDVEKITKLNDEIKDLYGKITAKDTLRAYNDTKIEIDSQVSFLQQIIVGAANGEDPDTIEQQSSCSGSCSSCSGCH